MPAAKPLLILGTRLLAEELADWIADIPGYEVAGFVENQERDRCALRVAGLPVYWIDELPKFAKTHLFACGIATTHRVTYLEQVTALGCKFATLIHPTSRVSSKSTLGAGTLISPGVQVASHTRLGRHVFVNRGALIGHHATIHDYATLQPGANLAGATVIGAATYIGMGAMVLDRIRVGAQSVVGAGSVVTHDVADNVQVQGVPARVVKSGVLGK
jgi:sugar O-acyltransferase (sialic acid O-acetyltransferase NeuD family)